MAESGELPPAVSTMVVHSDWPYNMLRVRRLPERDAEEVALVPMEGKPHPPAEQRYQWKVLEQESTPDFWKLASGSKSNFQAPEGNGGHSSSLLLDDYDEATEGWVVRVFQGHKTLEPWHPAEGFEVPGMVGGTKGLVTSADAAAACLQQVRDSGGHLLVLTGAGMSVSSGVPVFRGADGSMSADFLRFLGDFNSARARHKLEPVDDWFEFSVPEMFQKETEKESWAYWRWRILRALVTPAEDYRQLMQIIDFFGPEHCFVETSNCDMLHSSAGVEDDRLHEIHGSLGYLQCANQCCDVLYPADEAFRQRLRDEPEWIPRCPVCEQSCLRPNVMIFQDDKFVDARLRRQRANKDAFNTKIEAGNLAVLEVGAGRVVPSIRSMAEWHAQVGRALIRINPSEVECSEMETGITSLSVGDKYFPITARGSEALEAILAKLR